MSQLDQRALDWCCFNQAIETASLDPGLDLHAECSPAMAEELWLLVLALRNCVRGRSSSARPVCSSARPVLCGCLVRLTGLRNAPHIPRGSLVCLAGLRCVCSAYVCDQYMVGM